MIVAERTQRVATYENANKKRTSKLGQHRHVLQIFTTQPNTETR